MSTSDAVTEAFLEMYFARALADLFASVFGARFLRLWKPSPNGETYVGFDQGWVRHTGTPADFEQALRSAVSTRQSMVPTFYVGYFMQFKRAHQMLRTTKYTPNGIIGGHLRVEVDHVPSPTTKISQHETLIRLAGITGSDVSYACGMIFDADVIYDQPDLDLLRIVPVDAQVVQAFGTWRPGERHFIQFQDQVAAPIWCSKPLEGRSLAPAEWAREQRKLDVGDVLHLLDAGRKVLELKEATIPHLTIFEFEPRRPARRGLHRKGRWP